MSRPKVEEVLFDQHTRVVVSRLWHHPQIRVHLARDGILVSLSEDDFAKSIAKALRLTPPPLPPLQRRIRWTDREWNAMFAQHEAAVETAAHAAFSAVLEEAKAATIQHPPPLGTAP
jgi:hypothetical protein